MIAVCLKSVTNVNTRSAEDGAAAEVSGRAPLKSRSELEPPEPCLFLHILLNKWLKRCAGACTCLVWACTSALFHYTAASALPGRDPRCQSGPGVRWKMEGEAGRAKVDLLVTITIELLYKAPVDNIWGITEQEKQSSFIKKKGLAGVGGRQRLHLGRDDLCELGDAGGCRVWALQSLWVLLIYVFIFCMCTVQTWATHPLMRPLWICMYTNWCVWDSNCDGGGVQNAPSHMSWHVILCYIMVRHYTSPILFLYLPCFLAFLSALFCLKAEANFAIALI